MSQTPSPLARTIGIPGAVLLGLGSMVGTGVFVSIFIAGGVAGPAVILAIGIAALLAMANALSSAQLAAAHPVSGGTYEYGYRFLTPVAGFLAGWMFLLAKSASAATAALAWAAYLRAATGWQVGLVPIALALLALITLCALAGLRSTTAANAVIVSVTLTALLGFVVMAIPAWDPSRLTPFLVSSPGRTPVGSLAWATALSFVAFTGYGRVATLGEEIRDPRRSIPIAVVVTVITVALLYVVVALAAAGTVGTEALAAVVAAGGAPLEEAAAVVGGGGGRILLAVGALVATVGVLLNLLVGLSRMLLAMGRRGDMPTILARVHRGSPVFAVAAIAVIVAALVSTGEVRLTWSFSAITVLLYYATANAAALAVPDDARLYPRWVSAAGLLGCLTLVAFVEQQVLIWGVAALLSGLAWFGAARVLGRRR